jgi:hypothetical protein
MWTEVITPASLLCVSLPTPITTFLKPGPLTTFVHFLEHCCCLTSCDVLETQVNLYFLLKLLAPIPQSVLKHLINQRHNGTREGFYN